MFQSGPASDAAEVFAVGGTGAVIGPGERPASLTERVPRPEPFQGQGKRGR